MTDTPGFDYFDGPADEDRQSAEEYWAHVAEQHCKHMPQEGNHEFEKRVLLLAIDEGGVTLLCPGCKKPPLWTDEFMDGVTMHEVVVTSVLTSDRGHYPDYEPDGPWIELTLLDTGEAPPQDEPK